MRSALLPQSPDPMEMVSLAAAPLSSFEPPYDGRPVVQTRAVHKPSIRWLFAFGILWPDLYTAFRQRFNVRKETDSGRERNRKLSVCSQACGNALRRMFAAPLQSALIVHPSPHR